jgi:hypothetical protein
LVPRAPLATVSGTEVRQDPDGRGEYTVFNLCVRWAGGSHMLLKRWSECHCLHEALEKELGGLSARALADGASPTQVRGCWPKGLELQRKTKRCSVDDEKRIEKRARQLTAYFRDVGEWAGGEGIDVSTASQAWAEFCAPVDVDGAKAELSSVSWAAALPTSAISSLRKMFLPASERTYEGQWISVQQGYSAGRLAIAAFAYGDYQEWQGECLASLGPGALTMLWNVSSQMRPFSVDRAVDPMLDFSVPRTAADMPTLQILVATCRSIWSWIERGGPHVAVVSCHVDDLRDKVPMLLACLALWSRQCDDVPTAYRLAAAQLGGSGGGGGSGGAGGALLPPGDGHVSAALRLRAALPPACLRYTYYVDRVMSTGRLPVMGRVVLDMIVGDAISLHSGGSSSSTSSAAEPGHGATPLLQLFHRRKLLFSNEAVLSDTATTMRETGMLRLRPAELPGDGAAGEGADTLESHRPSFGRPCIIEGDCVLRLTLVPQPHEEGDGVSSWSTHSGRRASAKDMMSAAPVGHEFSFHTAFEGQWEHGSCKLRVTKAMLDPITPPGARQAEEGKTTPPFELADELVLHLFFSHHDDDDDAPSWYDEPEPELAAAEETHSAPWASATAQRRRWRRRDGGIIGGSSSGARGGVGWRRSAKAAAHEERCAAFMIASVYGDGRTVLVVSTD